MNKFYLLVAMVYCLCVIPLWADQEIVIYGDENYPPYSYVENGEAKGIYVDILKKAFEKMPNYSVSIRMASWQEGTNCLKNGECSAVFPMYHQKSNEYWVNYSEMVLKEKTVVFGTKSALAHKSRWPSDFAGSKIVLNKNTNGKGVGGSMFINALSQWNINATESMEEQKNLRQVATGRVDFVVSDGITNISKFSNLKQGAVVNVNLGYLGFTKVDSEYKMSPKFMKKFNKVIRTMKKNQEIDKIVAKYTN